MRAAGAVTGFLERDCDANLIIELGLEPGFDFSRHNPTDPQHQLWLALCLRHLRRRRTALSAYLGLSSALARVQYQAAGAAAAASGVTPSAAHANRAGELARAAIALLMPWLPREDNKPDAAAALAAWRQVYGDLNDPAVRAKMQRAIEFLQS